jgi:hypothetical protein
MLFWKDEESWRCSRAGIPAMPVPLPSSNAASAKPAIPWLSFDTTLASGDNLIASIYRKGVQLESVMIRSPMVFLTIRVSNMSFKKDVIIHITDDKWKTSRDVAASYLSGSFDGRTDRFYATITAPASADCEQMEFAICYKTCNEEFWDNNEGANYAIKVNPPSLPASSPAATPFSY